MADPPKSGMDRRRFIQGTGGRPNRIIYRAGPYGGAARQRQERVDGGYPMTGPDEGLLMGVRNVEPVNGGGDWTITQPDHWMFEGTGMKRGRRDSRPGRLGIPRESGRYSWITSRRRRHRLGRRNEAPTVGGIDSSRTKEQLRFQCGDNFLGARDEQSARTHAAMVARQPTAWRR